MSGTINGLQFMRREAGYTQVEVAEHLGINISTYQNKESRKTDFTLSEAIELADLLFSSAEEIHEELRETHTIHLEDDFDGF